MNSELANIALMFVLPLGITFILILQSAAVYSNGKKMAGAILSFFVVALDCLFYFAQNSFIAYNNDGGLLLTFASLFFLAVFLAIQSEETPSKVANVILAILMILGVLGISYWDRPTLIITSQYTPEEIALQNEMYKDYISSFQNESKSNDVNTSSLQKGDYVASSNQKKQRPTTLSDGAKSRLESYMEESRKLIKRMQDVENSIQSFGKLSQSLSESEREDWSRKALAISNNAMAINKKALGLFHPHESSEAHSEFIQSTESLRLAAYSLYSYTLQETEEDRNAQLKQTKEQLSQSKIFLERFINAIQGLLSNYKNQNEEQ